MIAALTFAIQTYGCTHNEYDSSKIEDVMISHGFIKKQELIDADIMIFNTCNVREKAVDKVYSDIGRLINFRKSKAKNSIIAVSGCAAQAEGSLMFERNRSINVISGPGSIDKLPFLINNYIETGVKQEALDFDKTKYSNALISATSQKKINPRAVLSVQEGCDNFCTFCCVPYTRGPEYSRPVSQLIHEAKKIVERGAIEISLLGQMVNRYRGLDDNGKPRSLGYLIQKLAEIDNLKRIWYTSSHPSSFCDELIEAHKTVPQLLPYVHLATQSGSDRILEKMNRKHTSKEFFDIIDKIRNSNHDIQFATDIIVGFPEETLEDYNKTIELVRKAKCIQVFAFAYSRREGTPAADNEYQIQQEEKKRRLLELQFVINEERSSILSKMVSDTPQKVLFTGEYDDKKRRWSGRTKHMVPIFAESTKPLHGLVDVKIISSSSHSVVGKVIAEQCDNCEIAL